MDSSKDGKDPQPQHKEELNPFVAFRRFADEQMSSLLHNMLGFSSSSRMTGYTDDDIGQKEAAERRQRILDERTREDTRETLRALDAICPPDQKVLRCPYRPDDQEVMRCPYRPINEEVPPENRAPRPALIDYFFNATPSSEFHAPKSLMGAPIFGYLLWSPYSPLHLEQDPVLRNQGDKWRRAFEDLTGTQIEGEMPDREIFEKAPLKYWRTMVGGGFGAYESIPGPEQILGEARAEREGWKDEFTELDLYERFLGSQYPQAAPSSSTSASVPDTNATTSQPIAASTPAEIPTPAPTVTSTLTTTERNTFPDGSVHTKVVLKKRFADGREESTETEHTSYSSQTEAQGPAKPFVVGEAKDASRKEASEGIAEQARKKGWFWS